MRPTTFSATSLLLLLTACAAVPIAETRESPSAVPGIDVLVLDPVVRFERIQDEGELPSADHGGDAIAASLLASTRRAVAESGFKVVEPGGDPGVAAASATLRSSARRVCRGLRSDAIDSALGRLAEANPRLATLAIVLEVTVGAAGSWNPMSGQILPSTSRCVLRAALTQAASKQVLWAQQVFLRELPSIQDDGLSRTVNVLYASFPKGGTER